MNRRPGFWAVAPVIAASLAATAQGCSTDAYCFACEDNGAVPDSGSQTEAGGTGGTMIVDGGPGDATPFDGCNADLNSDPLNCGACGNVCQIPNAYPKCVARFCVIDKCAPGFYDLNGQVGDGCEYECEPLRDQNGTPLPEESICDGSDDDCDGLVDETFDLSVDLSNCGACNHVCTPPPNTVMKCNAGHCQFDHCIDGYQDANHDITQQSIDDGSTDGCECNVIGLELCNYLDDDCDGEVDEGVDTTSDLNNCGACGNVCGDIFPHASSTCAGSVCVFGQCLPGYYDIDDVLLNGCEYACTPADPPTEQCNGVDDDCDGFVDNGTLSGVGAPCGNAVGECEQGKTQCVAGTIVCVGDVKPATEVCDGLNNDCDGTGATGTVDEGCPTANTPVRLDTAGSTAGQHSTSQLSVASQGTYTYAAYVDRRNDNADIWMSYLSSPAGNWPNADIVVANDAANEVEPWVFTSPTRVYVAHERFANDVRRVRVARTTSAPGTWTNVQAEKSATANSDSFLVRGVFAGTAGANDRIAVVWQRLNGTSRDVMLQASSDGGATWLASDIRVNGTAGKAEMPAIASNGNGKVFIAWRDGRGGQPEVYVDVYDFGTGSLAGNKKLSVGNPTQAPAIAADGAGNVHVVWTDLPVNERKRIRAATSKNAGATFGASVVINTPAFADASTPTVVAQSGRAIVAWEDNRSGLSDIYVNVWSSTTSTWWAQAVRADGGARGAYKSTRPRVAFGAGDTVYVTYQEYRGTGANDQADVYANFSWDGAQTFQPKDFRLDPGTAGAADSTSPFVTAPAPGSTPIFVWLDNYTTSGPSQEADVYAAKLNFP